MKRVLTRSRGWLAAALTFAALPAACIPDPPPASPNASANAPSSTQGAPLPAGKIEVALTLDDLPSHGPVTAAWSRVAIIDRILATLRKHALPPAYGFTNGKRVDEDPSLEEVLRKWVAAGNHLGNHSYSHPSLLKTAIPDYLADIDRGEAMLEKVEPGGPWRFFRYPFLFEGDTKEKRAATRAHLAERRYSVAEVTIEADDWAYNGPFARCTEKSDATALAGLRVDFVKQHVEELRRMRELTRAIMGREIRQVLLLHVGVADANLLDDLLTAYEREGVVWIDLPRALADSFYAIDPDLPASYGAAFPYMVAKARGVPTPEAVFARGLEERLEKTCR